MHGRIRRRLRYRRLNHPHIVTIHEIGKSEFGRFIVMELVEGRTLRDLSAGGVTWETAVLSQ